MQLPGWWWRLSGRSLGRLLCRSRPKRSPPGGAPPRPPPRSPRPPPPRPPRPPGPRKSLLREKEASLQIYLKNKVRTLNRGKLHQRHYLATVLVVKSSCLSSATLHCVHFTKRYVLCWAFSEYFIALELKTIIRNGNYKIHSSFNINSVP